MNTISETLPPPADDSTSKACVVTLVDSDPKQLLLGNVSADDYLSSLRPMVNGAQFDVATKAGREGIVSLAASVRKRKAAIDKTRLDLTEKWRTQTAEVNAKGKAITEKLAELAEEIRAPVTAWENSEAARIAEADAIIRKLEDAKLITFGMASSDVAARLEQIRGLNLNAEILGVRTEMAEELKADAVTKLTQAVADLKAQEAQARELEQLRAEQAAAEERRQREEQERAAAAAREAAAKAEAERLERARAEAAERAKREAEEQARREQEEREAEAQRQIEEANRRAAEAERAKQAERDRIERLAREAREREEAAAEAQRKREADIAHRAEVIQKAADALIGIPGMTQKMAKAVLHEIAAGTVPAVRIAF